jgi:hypothetical protein
MIRNRLNSGGIAALVDSLLFKVPTIGISIFIANSPDVGDFAFLVGLTTLITLSQALFEVPLSGYSSRHTKFSFGRSNFKNFKWKTIWLAFFIIFFLNFNDNNFGLSSIHMALILIYLSTSILSERFNLKLIEYQNWRVLVIFRSLSTFSGVACFLVVFNQSGLITQYLIFIAISQAIFLTLSRMYFLSINKKSRTSVALLEDDIDELDLKKTQTMSVLAWSSNQIEKTISVVFGSLTSLAVIGFFFSVVRLLNDVTYESLSRYFRVQIMKSNFYNLRKMSLKIFLISTFILVLNCSIIYLVFYFGFFDNFASYKLSLICFSLLSLPSIRNGFIFTMLFMLVGSDCVIKIRWKLISIGIICGTIMLVDIKLGLIALGLKECFATSVLSNRRKDTYRDFESRYISYVLHLAQFIGMCGLTLALFYE